MILKSATLLPSYPTTPYPSIDDIIIDLWNSHLMMEISSNCDCKSVRQNLEVTAAIINFWEEKLTEINKYEIQQRRFNCDKNP